MTIGSKSTQQPDSSAEDAVRKRILDAAFAAFEKNGYMATSTLEIATRARVSKRELYALVGNKHAILVACIGARATRLKAPTNLAAPRNREDLALVLASYGTQLLREVTDPTVITVFRLAIADAVRAPEVARTLDSIGRGASRAALFQIMAQAQAPGLLAGRPAELADRFSGLLWGNLMVGLLLGVAERPTAREIAARARYAASAFLQLHPLPDQAR
jgi:AcrR family transcriptional regulator